MELNLARSEVARVASTSANTMKVLPSAQKKQQKIVVGDNSGVVSGWKIKPNAATQQVFKTNADSHEVTSLALGGPRLHKDKIYAAFGQTIAGYKKKGKEFFRFNTCLNEDIESMVVENNSIWTAGEYIFSMFQNQKDIHFYMSSDKIHDMCLEFLDHNEPSTILGCQDRFVRILNGSELLCETAVEGPVTSIMAYPTDNSYEVATSGNAAPPNNRPGFKKIVYGTEGGDVGQLLVDGRVIRKDFLISPDSLGSSVTCLAHSDLTNDGVDDIIVGRDNGRLEVFSFDLADTPTMQFHHELDESIRSVDTGHLLTADSRDIVVCTYSGSIICFGEAGTVSMHGSLESASPVDSAEPGSMKAKILSLRKGRSGSVLADSTPGGVVGLRRQIDELASRIAVKRREYQELSSELVAVESQFKLKHSFRLIPSEAVYLLSVEIGIPIDLLALQSAVPVMVLDSPKGNAIQSIHSPDRSNGNELLATFRCIETSNCVSIKVRTIEGQRGELIVYVISRQYPKTCQTFRVDLKPLSLHEKIPRSSVPADTVLNKLRLSGTFSIRQMHSWISLCFTEVPPHCADDDATMAFRSSFLNTVFVCEYRRGEALFMSDSVSAISIAKEVISKEATDNKVTLSINLELSPETITTFLNLVRPKVEYHCSLALKHSKIAALKEMQVEEGEELRDFMEEGYMEILDSVDTIESERKAAPRHLDFLRGIVTDLFVDVHKLRGRSYQTKINELLELLEDFTNFDAVVALFEDI